MPVRGKLRAKFARGIRRILVKEERITHMDSDTFLYSTTFINHSDAPWKILEKGRELLVVKPGEEVSIESWKATTDWARWSKVVREKNELLTLTENPAWQNPWEGKFYCISLENYAGAPEESVQVTEPSPAATSARGYVTAVRGVPVIVPLNVMDPLVKFSKIIWHKKEIRTPIPGTKYFQTETRSVKEMVPRAKSDLRNVLKERQSIANEKLKEEQAKAMREQEKMLMDGEG